MAHAPPPTEPVEAPGGAGGSPHEGPAGVSNLDLLRLLAKGFIWLGAVACGVYLLLALPGVGSFSGFLLTVTDTVGRLSATVGLGAVLLALAEIADALRGRASPPNEQEKRAP